MSKKQQEEAQHRFQNDSQYKIMIITMAGAEGIDLYAAPYMIFVGRWWNPGKEIQLIGRIDRIGQTSPMTIYVLIALDTIDEWVDNLIAQKHDIYKDIVGVDESVELDITNDLIELLKKGG
jgi:SNF2 family DNA or RNA helicase